MITKNHLFYNLLLLLTAIIWGSTFFITKEATGSLSTAMILAIRFTVGAACLAFFCWKDRRKIDGGYLKWGCLLGLITFAAFGTHVFGLALETTPGKSAFLTAVYCVLVPFVYWLFRQGRPTGYDFGAAVLCLLGIGLVSLNEGLVILRGDLYTLLGGLLTAGEIVLISVACRSRQPLLVTCLQLATVALLAWLLVFAQGGLPPGYDAGDIAGIVYQGLFATAGCMGLQSIALKYTDPSAGALILSLEAVFGVIFSVLFYGEAVTGPMLAGFSLIFLAIILSQTKLRFLCGSSAGRPKREDEEAGEAGGNEKVVSH